VLDSESELARVGQRIGLGERGQFRHFDWWDPHVKTVKLLKSNKM
jgi:hypothetical protein